jgi:hypothetical protein
LIVLSALAGTAAAQGAQTDRLIFVGLRPKQADPSEDLRRLGEAQGIRKVIEAALQEGLKQPVVGHDELAQTLSKKYLVEWFNCAGDFACITKLLEPLRKAGYTTAVTGEYRAEPSEEPTTYSFHLTTFTLEEGKTVKDIKIEVPAAEIQDAAKWRERLQPLFASRSKRVKLTTNVAGFTCTSAGQPCVFDADGQTLLFDLGTHTIELTKEGYAPEQIVVTLDKASPDKEVAVALKKLEKGRKVDTVGGPRRKPTLTAIRTELAPDIDGRIDEPMWDKAWLESNFTQRFPDEAKAPTERTEMRVLYDDEAIYVAVRCFDSKPDKIVARLTRRDRDIDSDKVQVAISSKNDKASAYEFQVNAAGVQVDTLRFNDSEVAPEWDSLWYSATTIDALGWSAEFKIPLVALRYSGDTNEFGFQVRRILQRRKETDEWSHIPRDEQGEVSNYGTLQKLQELKAARLLQISPYDSRRVTLRRGQDPFDARESGGNFGADFKVGLTSALTLDATINPDFGTVEVDQVVLNLTANELFFPEKRPFFLEGSEVFSTPFLFFYTRRIGKQPSNPAGAPLLEPLAQGQIYGAAKVTGVLTGRTSLGLLSAVTAKSTALVERPSDGAPRKRMVDPLTHFGVLRLKTEFAQNSYVAGFATAVNRIEEENDATPDPGDLCPRPYTGLVVSPEPVKGRCTSDAYTGGLDTKLSSDDGKWRFKAQTVASVLSKGPARYIADGVVVSPGDLGYGVSAEAGKYAGSWLYSLKYEGAHPKLDLNDAGFYRANKHAFLGGLTWRTLDPHGPFLDQSYQLNAGGTYSWDFEGQADVWPTLNATWTLKNLWSVNAFLGPRFAAYTPFRETRSDVLAQYEPGYYYEATVATDSTKPIVLSSTNYLRSAPYGIGTATTLNLRPTPTLELDVIFAFDRVKNHVRWLDTLDNRQYTGTRTFYFAELDSDALSTTLRGTYTFTTRLSLQGYLQVYAANGDYDRTTSAVVMGTRQKIRLSKLKADPFGPAADDFDFREGTINANLFLRWEYRPGSALWLAYTRSQDQQEYDPMEGSPQVRFDRFSGGPATDVFLVKLSYLWQPSRRRAVHAQ